MEKKHLLSHAFSSYCSPPFGLGAIGCERTVKKSGAKHHSGADWLARCYQPAIKFLLYQSRLFEQADHLSPDDLIEEFLSDEAAVGANRASEFPPTIGSNAFVVVNLACAGLRRRSRQSIATLRTADQPLHDTRHDGTPARSYLV